MKQPQRVHYKTTRTFKMDHDFKHTRAYLSMENEKCAGINDHTPLNSNPVEVLHD